MKRQYFSKSDWRLPQLALCGALIFSPYSYAQEKTTETQHETTVTPTTENTPPKKDNVPLDKIRAFADVFARIKKDYVEPVKDKDLMESAIRGLLSGLDPHSSYLDQSEYQNLHEGTTGEFGGLGIEVGIKDGYVEVIAPIDDTPAQRAGVMAGDIIIQLDDKSVKDIGLNKAVDLMRGKPGEPIVLTILREGEEKPLEITIVRAIIKIKSVKSRILEPGYHYLRVTQFQSRTTELLKQAITQLRAQDEQPLKGVILDLRNNPGGVLNSAVGVSNIFLEDGLIVYTEGRSKDSATRFHATPGDMIAGVPMVAIVNDGSASASEIVAGALQDHRRAIILGEPTFGKGSVQTILPMNNGDAIKLTTARYFTPLGRSIQAKGIVPDIELHSLSVSRNAEDKPPRSKEAQLSGHLENGDDTADKPSKDSENIKLAETDYPLFEALNLLKSIVIVNSRAQQ